jgi:hypothetical protein
MWTERLEHVHITLSSHGELFPFPFPTWRWSSTKLRLSEIDVLYKFIEWQNGRSKLSLTVKICIWHHKTNT